MTSWWLHYSAIFCLLMLLCRAFPLLEEVAAFLGALLVTSHIAVLLAFYLRTKVCARVSPKNKAVLITGCDSGFGHHLAKRLDNLGYHVFAGCLFPDGEGATSLKVSCNRVDVIRLDITNDEDVQKAVEKIKDRLDGMDLWAVVNNAGVPCLSEVEWCTMSTYKRVLEVNTFGMIRITQAFLPLVRKCQGRFVNVNSGLGRISVPSVSAYCMSKHAAVAFTDCLRIEMRRWDVKVCSIEPWFYRTNMTTLESCMATAHKNWENAQEEVKLAYGNSYYKNYVQRLSEFLTRSSRPDLMEVVGSMEDAITSGDPNECYCPRGSWDLIKLGLAKITPVPALDYFVEMDMGYSTLIPADKVPLKAESL